MEEQEPIETRAPLSPFRKGVYFCLGLLSLGLTYIGIALPGVPAIPFILLAAFFFLRSSDRMYAWMLRRRVIGKLLRKITSKEKTPVGYKLFVISQLWVSITLAYVLFIHNLITGIIVAVAGVASSILIFRLMK